MRRNYTADFKKEILKSCEEIGPQETANTYGIPVTTIAKWRSLSKKGELKSTYRSTGVNPYLDEIKELKSRTAQLEK